MFFCTKTIFLVTSSNSLSFIDRLYRKRCLANLWQYINSVLMRAYRLWATYPRHADWIIVANRCLAVWYRFSISNTVCGCFIMILVLKQWIIKIRCNADSLHYAWLYCYNDIIKKLEKNQHDYFLEIGEKFSNFMISFEPTPGWKAIHKIIIWCATSIAYNYIGLKRYQPLW